MLHESTAKNSTIHVLFSHGHDMMREFVTRIGHKEVNYATRELTKGTLT